MIAAVLATAGLTGPAVQVPPCRDPMTVTLSQRDGVEIDVTFACVPGERATIQARQGVRCGVVSGDYVRGNSRVDRNGSRVFRLIDRQERANDLAWDDGRLAIRRGGLLVASVRLKRGRCR